VGEVGDLALQVVGPVPLLAYDGVEVGRDDVDAC